jgi:SAM-dependent methyltransferase
MASLAKGWKSSLSPPFRTATTLILGDRQQAPQRPNRALVVNPRPPTPSPRYAPLGHRNNSIRPAERSVQFNSHGLVFKRPCGSFRLQIAAIVGSVRTTANGTPCRSTSSMTARAGICPSTALGAILFLPHFCIVSGDEPRLSPSGIAASRVSWESVLTGGDVLDLLRRMVRRDDVRSEADVQADIRQLLLSAPLQLDDGDLEIVLLESPLGDRRRIDIEVGSAVIEVKRDLRRGRVRTEAIDQLAGYVSARAEQTGRRYLGLLADGAEWICYDLRNGELVQVATVTVGEGQAELDRLLIWIEGVLATARDITPTAAEISARLGAGSSAHQLDSATIASLYERNRDLPSIRMKRGLWSRLLTSTLGTQFEDSDELFVEHTLLVNSAEIIAHAVLGIDAEGVTPHGLLSGEIFEQSGIYGVVEEDFFDWVLEVEGGPPFVRALARRLSRFDWSEVDQDFLKVLYESVIGAETRKRLGEYYTPDWLASLVVSHVVDAPLTTRVLDPACGSGTFLFQAIRGYIQAAELAGWSVPDMLQGITRSVIGMDLHPVAVTFARVTYLLAIGRRLLTDATRGQIAIPVYLGDSMQWTDQSTDLWNAGSLVVPIEDRAELFSTELRFPDRLLEDAVMFDGLVEGMADMASRRRAGGRIPSLSPLFQRLAVPVEVRETIESTFRTMCSLHEQGRDHIWSYYVRNLARPLWLSRASNRVDALIGNPPWLAYRHMPSDMQAAFKAMSEDRGLWHGAENATHQDLSALFVARATQLYLRQGGHFGMVMPNAVVDRDHYAGFRTGNYEGRHGETRLVFSSSWDLRRVRPHFFPRGSSVVFGHRDVISGPMPTDATIYNGTLPRRRSSLADVQGHLEGRQGHARLSTGTGSPYRSRFRQGAILSPVCFSSSKDGRSAPSGPPPGKQQSCLPEVPTKRALGTGFPAWRVSWRIIFFGPCTRAKRSFRIVTPSRSSQSFPRMHGCY